MLEGKQFLDDVMGYFEDKKPDEYKKLKALAKKYGDGSFSAYNDATQVQILSVLYNHITIFFSLCIKLITANPKNKNIIPIIIY